MMPKRIFSDKEKSVGQREWPGRANGHSGAFTPTSSLSWLADCVRAVSSLMCCLNCGRRECCNLEAAKRKTTRIIVCIGFEWRSLHTKMKNWRQEKSAYQTWNTNQNWGSSWKDKTFYTDVVHGIVRLFDYKQNCFDMVLAILYQVPTALFSWQLHKWSHQISLESQNLKSSLLSMIMVAKFCNDGNI